MKKIQLPIMSSSTGLSAAIDSLKKVKRGALLAKVSGLYRLYSASDIVSGRKKGLNTLADLFPESSLSIREDSLRIENRLLDGVIKQVINSYASVEISDNDVCSQIRF